MAMPIIALPGVADPSRTEIAGRPTEVESSDSHPEKPGQCSSRKPLPMEKDFYILSNHISVAYDDIFTEPAAIGSGDIGKHLSSRLRSIFSAVFVYAQEAVYYFLTIITGLFFGLAWGSVLGAVSFVVVWFFHPLITVVFIVLRTVSLPLTATVRTLLDPFFQSASQVFASVSVSVRPSPTFRAIRRLGLESGGGLGPRTGPLSTIERQTDRSQEWFGYV